MLKLRNLPLVLLPILLVVAIAAAAEQTVILKDGGKLTGQVEKTDGCYRIKTATGIILTIAADQVVSITEARSPQQEYASRLAAIDKADAEARVALAEWAMSENLDDIAMLELKAALELNPAHEKAQLLLRQLEARAKVTTTPTTGATKPADSKLPTAKDVLVSQEDIYRIRLAEIVDFDQSIAVKFRDNVVERFIESAKAKGEFASADALAAFRTRPPWMQAGIILDRSDPEDFETRDDILVQADPPAIQEFRNRVWPMVQQSCAATECHGGAKIKGGLKFFRTPPTTDNVFYTNFLIVSTFMSGNQRMIDRDVPELSLLLQMGLPQDMAKLKHPTKIRGFTGRDDPKYRAIETWINSLKRPRPAYKLDYQATFNMKLQMRPAAFPPASAPAGPEAPADKPSAPFGAGGS